MPYIVTLYFFIIISEAVKGELKLSFPLSYSKSIFLLYKY